ncbi:hypothetical protein D6851_16520 [Altericroceibacterium spongiae]|uniref:Heme acquisition protein HasA n=1 Tax=Altericroceibacterium spongiae TaxID=2320269 RepID=A0A420EA51_9SPHN|nr:hypothetical protein [Altericroceibacterium spongiae]RKF17556.1 hypothetical protein D6851_16520 [Altericroceibacterium spongiae]
MSVSLILGDDDNFTNPLSVADSLEDVLNAWENPAMAGSHPDTTGEFSGTADNSWSSLIPDLSGDAYTYGNDTLGYAFEVTGDLYYFFNDIITPGGAGQTTDTHVVFGEIETITISTSMADIDGSALFTFDFTGDEITSALSEGQNGDIFEIIDDLMNGSTDTLQTVLSTDYGVNLADSVADLVAASPLSEELLLAA